MRLLRFGLLVAAGMISLRGAAMGAEPVSAWNPSHTRIYTTMPDGARIPGGKVGDIREIQFALGVEQTLDFVRSQTSSGKPLRWAASCVFVTPDAAGSQDIAGDEETAILDRVLANWTQSTRSCGYLTFMRKEPVSQEVGYDGVNLVKYREDRWCRPAMGGDPEECYSSGAAALTTLFFVDKPGDSDDGTILDADIEINEVNFAMATDCMTSCVTLGDGTISDLENTLTHEVGHMIGLDHTCWDGATPTRPNDDMGNPVPDCFPESALSTEIREATMYNFQNPGETKKISLEQDDIDGFCAIYPVADDPGVCEPVDVGGDGGCCSVAGRRRDQAPTGLGLLGAGGVACMLAWRRRRRRRAGQMRVD